MKRKKHGGKDFTANDPRINTKGRPRLAQDLQAVQLFTKDELKKTISKYLMLTPDELSQLKAEVKFIRALDVIVIQFIISALQGDHYKAEWLMQRSIGRPIDSLDSAEERRSAHTQLIEYIKARQTDLKPAE